MGYIVFLGEELEDWCVVYEINCVGGCVDLYGFEFLMILDCWNFSE